MRTRNRSIRARVISLLVVPLSMLVVMWVLATTITLGPGLDLLNARRVADRLAAPVQDVVATLQEERKESLLYLATNRRSASDVLIQRARTDEAIAALRPPAQSTQISGEANDLVRQRIADTLLALDSVTALRGSVDRAEIDRTGALRGYTTVIDTVLVLREALVPAAEDELARQGRALIELSQVADVLSQEDATISAAVVAGPIGVADLGKAVQLIGVQRFLLSSTMADLNPTERTDLLKLIGSDSFTRLASLENRLIVEAKPGSPLPVTADDWSSTYQPVASELAALAARGAQSLAGRSTPTTSAVFGRLAVTGVLGLLGVVITIITTIKVARGLIKRLAGLRQAALELAVDRLPRVMTRLRRGEPVDVTAETPALPYSDDEIGQVGHAFNELQRTAVNAAVEEAALRAGLNEVFLNIARRSQTLLHRQLSILDQMERRTDDPAELEDLFRVDHLATRMRRHAEDLVILAGAAPGRGWRNPVPIMDVLRGAVSEVEDFARVSIRPMPDVAIEGRAVGDLIHLLAELVENATSFSPPQTRVSIGAEMVAHGFAIEIEDRGLGLAPEVIAEINRRLADPPEFDPANSAQLGLFVVARLAQRHGARVALRSSAYGGVTAVLLVPEELVITTTGAVERRPRAAVAALDAGGSGSSGSPDAPGAGGGTYREIPTAARPAISAPPTGAAPTNGGPTSGGSNSGVPPNGAPTYPAPATAGSATPMPVAAAQVRLAPPADSAATMAPSPAPKAPARSRRGALTTPAADEPSGRAGAAGQAPPTSAGGRSKRVPKPRHAPTDIQTHTDIHTHADIIDVSDPDADGLPRRVRQSSLAPQLRGEAPMGTFDLSSLSGRAGGATTTPGPPARSPEDVRAMMRSFQAGLLRGRRDSGRTGSGGTGSSGTGYDDDSGELGRDTL